LLREDVDNDGAVKPLDVLKLINSVNAYGSRDLPMVPEGEGSEKLPPYLDPTGDDKITPEDVLQVIKYINKHAEGEGEFVSTDTQMVAASERRLVGWYESLWSSEPSSSFTRPFDQVAPVEAQAQGAPADRLWPVYVATHNHSVSSTQVQVFSPDTAVAETDAECTSSPDENEKTLLSDLSFDSVLDEIVPEVLRNRATRKNSCLSDLSTTTGIF